MKLVFCLLLFLCPFLSFSQQAKPLSIGETLSGKYLGNMKNYPRKVSTIKDLNSELVLLDFWSTYCGSCLEAIPKMNQLQERFSGKLQIIAVNYVEMDTEKRVAEVFAILKKRFGYSFTLPYILQDKILFSHFPHKTIPHIVWLNGNGKVLAITDEQPVTAENISTVLSGKELNLSVKNDQLLFDANTQTLAGIAQASGIKPLYQSIITEEQPEIGAALTITSTGKLITRRDMINIDLFTLYNIAFQDVMKNRFNRIYISDKIRPAFFSSDSAMRKRIYCYEIMTSAITRKQADEALRNDLVRYFNIIPVRKDSLLDCYVLKSTGTNEKLFTKGGKPALDDEKETIRKFISNGSSDQLMGTFEKIFHKPWVNETNLSRNIDIEFPKDIFDYDIDRLNAWLQPYNLKILEESRNITIALLTTATTQP